MSSLIFDIRPIRVELQQVNELLQYEKFLIELRIKKNFGSYSHTANFELKVVTHCELYVKPSSLNDKCYVTTCSCVPT